MSARPAEGRQRMPFRDRRLVGLTVVALLTGFIGVAPTAQAYPSPGTTERVSVASDGSELRTGGGSGSNGTAISADGRYVAFTSTVPNVSEDCQGRCDAAQRAAAQIYLRDRVHGRTELVSVSSDGDPGSLKSYFPHVSADGRFVVFLSSADNLVDGDTNGQADVFVRDREEGRTERVSVTSDGEQVQPPTFDTGMGPPRITPDGRHVVFSTVTTGLVPGDTNSKADVFVHDRATGTTEIVSVGHKGQGNGYSKVGDISADGRYVVFSSGASNLVPGDTNQDDDIFLRDRDAGKTTRVSVTSDGTQTSGGDSYFPLISADGGVVAFRSKATNVVPSDYSNGSRGTYVRGLATGVTEKVVQSDGSQLWHTDLLALSSDGRFVLVSGMGAHNSFQHYVHDRATGTSELVSVPVAGAPGEDPSSASFGSLTPDGRFVAFASDHPNLVEGDSNDLTDVFVRDRGLDLGVGRLEVQSEPGTGEVSVSGWARFAGEVIVDAADLDDDGEGGPGAELTGASITYRPEREDLLVRITVQQLPVKRAGVCVPRPYYPEACFDVERRLVGDPDVVYGIRLVRPGGSTSLEVRASTWGDVAGTGDPTEPRFGVYECSSLEPCQQIGAEGQVSGGVGTTGHELRFAVPLDGLFPDGEGVLATAVHAFAGRGALEAGSVLDLDGIDLGEVKIPERRVEVAVTDSEEEDGDFSESVQLSGGEFSGRVDTSGLSPGQHFVRVRACMGERCGEATVREVTS